MFAYSCTQHSVYEVFFSERKFIYIYTYTFFFQINHSYKWLYTMYTYAYVYICRKMALGSSKPWFCARLWARDRPWLGFPPSGTQPRRPPPSSPPPLCHNGEGPLTMNGNICIFLYLPILLKTLSCNSISLPHYWIHVIKHKQMLNYKIR